MSKCFMMKQKEIIKEYSNGEVTIVWKPNLCIHSKFCITGLPQVFDYEKRPWINAQGTETEDIITQVQKCPSGALSYYLNGDVKDQDQVSVETERLVEAVPNGPLMIYGNIHVKHSDGTESHHEHRVTAFCRCGGSGNKPFCDGTHLKNGFKG